MVAGAGVRRRWSDERGMASIVAAALVGVLALVGVAGLALGQFALTRQRAATVGKQIEIGTNTHRQIHLRIFHYGGKCYSA